MASNVFGGGSGDDIMTFVKPVGYLSVYVSTGTTFSLSLDKGNSYITMPAGFHSFKIGPVKEIRVQSNGVWQLIGVQE